MKNRFIIKAELGTSRIRPLTSEDIEQIVYKHLLEDAAKEPTWADYAYKGFHYMLNPISAVSDWVLTQDWAPEWLKTSAPYMAAIGPAMTKNSAASRGNSARVLKNVDRWTNLETLGSVYGDRSAGGIVYKNGEPTKIGDVGRPIKLKVSQFMLKVIDKDINSTLKRTKIVNGTHTRQPDVTRSRGRISNEALNELFELFDKQSVSVPLRNTLSGNALRTVTNRFKHWDMYGNTRIALYQKEIADGNRASAAKLGQLRLRMQGIEKKMRLNGWDPTEFRVK